jgi:hypothetical protein
MIAERRAEHQFLLTAWVFLPDPWHAIFYPRHPLTIWRVTWIACCCPPMDRLEYKVMAHKSRRGTQKARSSALQGRRILFSEQDLMTPSPVPLPLCGMEKTPVAVHPPPRGRGKNRKIRLRPRGCAALPAVCHPAPLNLTRILVIDCAFIYWRWVGVGYRSGLETKIGVRGPNCGLPPAVRKGCALPEASPRPNLVLDERQG